MQPTALMTGLSTPFTTPKITATAISVSTLDSALPVVSWMPGTSQVATARAAAEATTRIRARMEQSWHTGGSALATSAGISTYAAWGRVRSPNYQADAIPADVPRIYREWRDSTCHVK